MEDNVTQGYAQPVLGWLWASYNTVTSTLANPSDSAAIKLSGTINPNLLVEASINYDGNVINIANSANWPSCLPAGACRHVLQHRQLPMCLASPASAARTTPLKIMGSAPWHNAARDYEPKVDISYTAGKHAMKFGFSYNRYTKNQQLFGDAEGDFGFGNLTNDGMMDFLLGICGQLLAVPGNADPALREPDALRVRVGQLARDAAVDPAAWPSLRRSAARLGAQQRSRQLRPGAVPLVGDSAVELRRLAEPELALDSRSSTVFRSTSTAWVLRERTASRGAWWSTTTTRCSLASVSLKTSSATARPFSVAASAPSSSASRATTSTTRRRLLRSPSTRPRPTST